MTMMKPSEDNTLVLTNIASKICDRLEDEECDINESVILNEFNQLISKEFIAERLVSMSNNIYSKEGLISLMNESESQVYVTNVVCNYMSKNDTLY